MGQRWSQEGVAARDSPDLIRTGDVFVKDEESGLEYRFEGSDVEYAEAYASYCIEHPPHEYSFPFRPLVTRFGHDAFKRKPSLAILSFYTADHKLQELNIDVNKGAIKEDLSKTSHLETGTNYNSSDSQNCSTQMFEVYANPSKTALRRLERCVGETYCPNEYNALKEHVATQNRAYDSDYLVLMDNYATCAVARPEFKHIQKVADKLYHEV